MPFSCSRLASRGSANHSSVDSRIVGASETGFEQINCDFLQADFGPASKSAIKCRIRSTLTQAKAAIAIATSFHR